VIEQTVREKLPEGFQRSEFLLDHGAIDMIVHRQELRQRLGNLLAQMMGLPTPKFVRAETRADRCSTGSGEHMTARSLSDWLATWSNCIRLPSTWGWSARNR
jgi:hypothetical protein